jgi:hypothetical protein
MCSNQELAEKSGQDKGKEPVNVYDDMCGKHEGRASVEGSSKEPPAQPSPMKIS